MNEYPSDPVEVVIPPPSDATTRLVPDPEHVGPREDWYCGCRSASGQGNVLRGWMNNWCSICRVVAPWMTWEVCDV